MSSLKILYVCAALSIAAAALGQGRENRIYKGVVVADDSVEHLQVLMSRSSLEGVFSQLVIKDDPARIAADLASVAALGA